MKIEKIKPIPKYIQKKIKLYDDKLKTAPFGRTRFYAYFTKNDGELVKVTVAVKEKRNKWYCKQVAVHGVHSDKCFVKDMNFTYIAGYTVGWHAEGLTNQRCWYEYGEWGWTTDDMFDPYATIVNREYILEKFPEYKYSAIDKYTGIDVFKYLRLFEQYPQIEYLTKLGLHNLAMSKQILKKCGQDKRFCKWLAQNRNTLNKSSLYIPVVLQAYKKNRSVLELQAYYKAKLSMDKDQTLAPLRNAFKREREKLYHYLSKQNTNTHSYLDYWNACNYLRLNMTDEKNRYPHDFKRWHDIRIDEYHTMLARDDEQKRKDFYDKFAAVAEKYLGLQYDRKSDYIAIIALSPNDLVREGQILEHCVGRMNYDQKFVREESLIFFIRTKEAPNTPLVTVEYSPSRKKILQCYGKNDSTPNDNILEFVNKKWLPFANRQLKKIAA